MRPIEEQFAAAEREVSALIDDDFLAFEARLVQAYPELDAATYAAITGVYAAHGQQRKQDFLQRFGETLNSDDDECD
jgi:hypothetical protein